MGRTATIAKQTTVNAKGKSELLLGYLALANADNSMPTEEM